MIDLTIPKFIELIPDYVISIAEDLQAAGFEAYLVGGSIRDVLLGKIPTDYDIATNAYPEDIQNIFQKTVPTGAKFGTIIVVSENEQGERFDVEVTTYRSDADYVGGRWPTKVEFTKTIEEDLARRDFTINAIALDLQNFDESDVNIQEILVDPYNGISDLENKVIKAVRDPLERFTEDGLRAVRACRLAAQLEFEIESTTFEAMKQTNHITKQISVERFRDELMKLLMKSPKPSVGLRLMKDAGILALFIPELLEGIDVTQPEYHVEDVFEHSLKTCDAAEDSIKVAALFHDIGKPRTMSKDDKGTHFYGHDQKGAEITKEIMQRLKFPNAEIERTVKLVRWHMFYYPSGDWRKENLGAANVAPEDHYLESEISGDSTDSSALGWTDGAIRRLIMNVGGEDAIDDLFKLRIADATSNPKAPFNPKEIDALASRVARVRAEEMALKVTDLDINGHDLTEIGVEGGKQMGEILNQLLEMVIDDPMLNKKETLLEKAKELKVKS
ncbi:HD domain-containing protein [Candidatus Dojkabacteria bacterium]|uniref:HD domain-containing protein n=1 Tax=Candidatus Dojkabacteria bacterium TaxID=2099670 RepID=A0A955I9S7_9BACT|nr:HD domain-containing protein [Candidatus Dojkabacteria bacterium]